MARSELGELNGYSHRMPNPMLLLSPAIVRESVASSNIENINTTVGEVLQAQLFPEIERPESNKEVLRYREALIAGDELLKKFPISERLVNRIHDILIPGPSGGIRKIQNKIINTKTGEIIYTPPAANEIPDLLKHLMQFCNKNNDIDPLLKTALVHYQFEGIHPYLDGNGRTGRILMVLMLKQYEILTIPVLFISGYIEKRRSQYYNLLLDVTKEQNWIEFLLFIIRGFREQAAETKQLLFQISALLEEFCQTVKRTHPKIYSYDLVETIFTFPVITPAKLSEVLSIHRATASRYLATLSNAKILTDSIVGKYHLYINKKLISLLNG
ncbi:MAG TPA: Fic family protein [Candidatus Kapabacteria bacterium]|nr:Fic family protein [Candidatus Kapabacteria bacterium]